MGDIPLEGFRSVLGQGATLELLRRAIHHDRVASAYLFTGPPGVGKDRAARALAQVMNCADPAARAPGGDACGRCRPCRKIASGMHPDLLILQRESKDEKGDKGDELKSQISVEQVRELCARMPFRPHEGGTRWVVVREAERFHPFAANAFLKTLEEPPEATHFVLLTHAPSSLLATIRSRCQAVRFAPLEAPVVEAVLTRLGVAPDVAASVAPLADGSLRRAMDFTDAEQLQSRRAFVDRLLAALQSRSPGAFVDVAEEGKSLGREDLDAVLALFHRHFRLEAIARAEDRPARAAALAARAEIVRETLDLLDGAGNLNPQLTLENMLVRLREVRA